MSVALYIIIIFGSFLRFMASKISYFSH